ncbi:hypothetical protein H310_02683 [Aphanomyces invadans]|uniref:Uncharacterized protein n=1 Tax=Aphanomyces invadans TaxID=157072 RepID=A0A024UJH7_9STRA|nr:hypothetical protein H310_02683 [Aphanomyces invadans]ETW06424.1 hypothetical protein H310_02683 [Aphanomyces invadans]|eukprot:XP_008864499.1 hypothetical protein H310_02683 [Aphanomyces invadans]
MIKARVTKVDGNPATNAARRRNEYQRHAQKRFRKVRSGKRQQLCQLVIELEAEKVAARSPDATTDRRSRREPSRLGRAMWVYVSNVMAARTCLRQGGGIVETWQHVSLPSAPLARHQGLDWITSQLYHTTRDAVLAAQGFPASHHRFIDIQGEDDGSHRPVVTIQHQRVVHEPWTAITARCHSFVIESNGFGYDSVETLCDDNGDA